MSANVPANARGISSGFEIKDANRENIRPPYQLPESFFELKEKWCEHCGRRHAAGQCQFLMVDHMLREGIAEKTALTQRLFQEGWEEGRRLRNWRAVKALRESHLGTNSGNTVSAGQLQQQTSPRASRFSEGPFEVSDSEDEFSYEDEFDVDDEPVSGASSSAPAPASEVTHAKKQYGETEKPMGSGESLCWFVLLSTVFVLILGVCWMSLVAKFGLRLGLAVYDV
ncbi:Hypothetical protein PENO1_023120 [Penicillium occitanis (nom. inval.)]|nr:hypothetical protein PENOC_040490 [Penicillium occitanis (nom. inval.)]PCH05317.1 Hypothetical protein PENO1_023120 [Penicillium occitanis (nom. inval.)]